MKFTIEWIEVIPNDNLDLCPLEERLTNLPNPEIITRENMDNCTEIFCSDIFDAKSTEEAKQTVEEQYYEVDFFDCKDEQGKTVFTEEDL